MLTNFLISRSSRIRNTHVRLPAAKFHRDQEKLTDSAKLAMHE